MQNWLQSGNDLQQASGETLARIAQGTYKEQTKNTHASCIQSSSQVIQPHFPFRMIVASRTGPGEASRTGLAIDQSAKVSHFSPSSPLQHGPTIRLTRASVGPSH